MRRFVLVLVMGSSLAVFAQGPAVTAPPNARAGGSINVSTGGSGEGTFYVIGPGHVSKRKIQLGSEVEIKGAELQTTGSYHLLACGDGGCGDARMFVVPTQPEKLAFLLHP